jgi:hypothetical protein
MVLVRISRLGRPLDLHVCMLDYNYIGSDSIII